MRNRLIGLAGYAGVGKDTAARNMSGWERFAFADPLKTDLLGLFPFEGVDLKDPAAKEKMRPLMVAYGATARAFDPDCWLERTMSGVMACLRRAGSAVITDCRYSNECQRILDMGGVVIRIKREGYGPANNEEAISFVDIQTSFNLPTVWNDGTPEELGERVMKVFRERNG